MTRKLKFDLRVTVAKRTTPKTTIKNINLYFTYESRGTLTSFTLFITVKTIKKLNLEHSDEFEIGRDSSSLHNAEFGHFTLLVCRGRQRNVQRLTHVHSHCSAH